MSAVETGQMSSVETGQICSVETGQMCSVESGQICSVPESSGFAWACGVCSGAPRRGLTRGEESEEGGSVDYSGRALPQHPLLF